MNLNLLSFVVATAVLVLVFGTSHGPKSTWKVAQTHAVGK